MNLEYVKLLSAFGLWLLTFAFSMLPVFWFKKYQLIDEERRRQNFRSMSFFNCFGAGVFLGTCLLHLLPDVQEQMAFIFKTANLQSTYPAAEFLFGFGFLTILVVEQIIMTFKDDDLDEPRPILNTESSIDDSSHLIPPNTSHTSTGYGSINVNCDRHIEFSADDSSHLFPSITGHSSTDYGSISINPDRHNHDVTFADSQASNSVFRSILLVVALSLHSIFEGLAIGLQISIKDDLKILLAVMIHKCIIAFTVGLNLTRSDLRKISIIKSNFFFALSSPVGILLGVFVMDVVQGLSLVITSGILQGMAAGTFLYVTIFEVLFKELTSGIDRMVKVGAVVLGYSVVSLLLTFLPE